MENSNYLGTERVLQVSFFCAKKENLLWKTVIILERKK